MYYDSFLTRVCVCVCVCIYIYIHILLEDITHNNCVCTEAGHSRFGPPPPEQASLRCIVFVEAASVV